MTGVGILLIFTLCSVHLVSANPSAVSENSCLTFTVPAVVTDAELVQVKVSSVVEVITNVSSTAVPDV